MNKSQNIQLNRMPIFLGYQLHSEFHEKEEINIFLKKITNILKRQYNLDIQITIGEFVPGKILYSEVLNSIKGCEIALFDISENNPNVLIEVGIALGFNKKVILLKNKISKLKTPADINAYIYFPYDKINSLESCKQLAKTINIHSKNIIKSPYNNFYSLWGFSENDEIFIVCPEGPNPDRKQFPEPEEFLYLGKYGDIDSLIVIFSSLKRLYPKSNIKFCTSEEFKQLPGNPHANNLIIIGGPDYNQIAEYYKRYSPYDFQYKKDEVFLINRKNKKRYKSKISEMEVIDYGFFVKRCNPNNPNKKLILISGIHTYGVYGCAKIFSLYEEAEESIAEKNCREVSRKHGIDPSIAILVEVRGIRNKVQIPEVKIKDVISIKKD